MKNMHKKIIATSRRHTTGLAVVGAFVILGTALIVISQATTVSLAGAGLYINPDLSPAVQYRQAKNTNQPYAGQLAKIGTWPIATWFGGWNTDIEGDVDRLVDAAVSRQQIPVMVAYNIPQRDCGQYSSGGAGSQASYDQWVRSMAAGINGRSAVVILEPDALGLLNCLNEQDKQARYGMLERATTELKANGALVYLDASSWVNPADMAGYLQKSGISNAAGFALNTSGYERTEAMVALGNKLSPLVGNKRFVIDTSRNGNGPWTNGDNEAWCNPPDRALGKAPTTTTGIALVDAFLWVKVVGESDGTCRGGPPAGQWWLEYALGLAERSSTMPNPEVSTPAPAPAPAPTPSPAPAPAPTPVGPGVYNDTIFSYSGSWQKGDNSGTGFDKYQADDYYSNTKDSTYSLQFTGRQVNVYSTKAPEHGIAAISVDGGPEVSVDTYATARADQVLIYASQTLSVGTHTITIRSTGTKNSASLDTYINADRIAVSANSTASTPISGDANSDGRVNGIDYSILVANDGKNFPAADFNRDGIVGAADLAILLSSWTW